MKKIMIILLLGIMTISFASAGLLDGLISFYPLDNTSGGVWDSFLNNNGTNVGMQRGVAGIIANSFNNTNIGHINISNDGSATFNTSSVSVSFWVKHNPIAAGDLEYFIDKTNGVDVNSPFYVFKSESNNRVTFHIANGSAESTVITGNVLANHNWLHFVATYNESSGNQSIYYNGTMAQTIILPNFGSLASPEERVMYIGARGSDVSKTVNGTMDEVGIWNRALTPSEVAELYGDGLAKNMSSITEKSVTLNAPINDSTVTTKNVTFNTTLLMQGGISLNNATLFLYDDVGNLLNNTENIVTASSSLDALFTILNLAFRSYIWNVEMFYTDKNGLNQSVFSEKNFSFQTGGASINTFSNSVVFETSAQTFQLNITLPEDLTITTSTLFWNHTEFTGTNTLIAGDNYSITHTMDIPLINGTVPFNWNITYSDSSVQDFGTANQSVNSLHFGQVNATQPTSVLNISFQNETVSKESVNALVSTYTSNYYLGSGSVFKSFTFTNATENFNYTFGTNTGDALLVNYSINYDNSYSSARSYLQQIPVSLTSVVTEVILFLLPSSLDVPVTFQILNAAQQPVSGAFVNVTREGYGLMESTITSDSGTVTFNLDPEVTYTVCADTDTSATFCTTDQFPVGSYTISLGTASDTVNPVSYFQGMTWVWGPSIETYNNNTMTDFNFTLVSTYNTVTSFGFELYGDDTLMGTRSAASNGGFINFSINTWGNKTIEMKAFWIIDGNYSNVSQSWISLDKDDGDFSASVFFDRLDSYTNSSGDSDGLFGLKKSGSNIGISLFVFMIILIVTGMTARNYGITSEVGILGIIFALVFLFDGVFGLVPQPVFNGISVPIATVIIGLLYSGFLIREVRA